MSNNLSDGVSGIFLTWQ